MEIYEIWDLSVWRSILCVTEGRSEVHYIEKCILREEYMMIEVRCMKRAAQMFGKVSVSCADNQIEFM